MIGIVFLINVLVMFIIWDADLHPVRWITKLITSRIQIAQRHAWDQLEQELRLWSGEQGPELAYMSPSMAMQEVNQALTLMACTVYHQPIEPYVPPPPEATPIIRIGASSEPIAWIDKAGEIYYPPSPEPRYEIVMHDECMVLGDDEVDHGKVGVSLFWQGSSRHSSKA